MVTLDQLDQRLKISSQIVYDSETNGLDWRTNRIVGHVITFSSDPRDSWYFPVRHEGSNPYDPDKVASILRKYAANRDLRWVMHNAAFDLSMLSSEGIDVSGVIEDTSINEALINEYAPSFSLDSCCRRHGVTEKKGDRLYEHMAKTFGGEATRDQMANFWRLSSRDEIALDYATGDGTSTWELHAKQQNVLDREDLRTVWDVECRLISVLHRMSMRGIRINEDRMGRVINAVEKAYDKAREKIPKDLNERSPIQMEKYFQSLGYDDYPRTALRTAKVPNGNPSFPEEWLITNPAGQDIVRVRKLSHMLNSFLYPLRDRHIFRGRVNPQFHQTRDDNFGTVTGRLSASDPNTQQAHKRNKELGPLLRCLFVPDDGYEWNSDDLSQCEPRLLAHYSESRVLVEGFLADPPVDAHTSVANAAGIDRESGKRVNQAIVTGAGRNKIITMIGKGAQFGAKVYDDYFAVMPEVRTIQKNMTSVMERRGYIRTILKRRCRLNDHRFAYKALNRALQGSNADIIKESMVRISEETAGTPGYTMLNNVHDALDSQTKIGDKDAQRALARAREIFVDYGPGRHIKLLVPMAVDCRTGRDWAEATWGTEIVSKALKAVDIDYKRF